MGKRGYGGYGGGGGFGGMNMQQMMQQAQKMQQDIADAQAALSEQEITGTAGGGVVTATVTGDKKLKEIKISPEVIDPDDPEMLQDLVIAAVNDALANAEALAQKTMGAATGGMNLGGLL